MTPSLYVHIPFCRSKCSYCDFFSVTTRGAIPDKYVEGVINEAVFYAEQYGVTSWDTVYIGGGTPSLLEAGQIARLVKGLLAAPGGTASAPREITLEANPESLTEEKLAAAAASGVTRLSVGLQALCGAALRSVRRGATEEETREAAKLIKRVWKGRVSYDVMAGLPALSREAFESSLREILSFEPGHISLYTLTLEEDTPLYKSVAAGRTAFDPDEADAQWLSGRDILIQNGYAEYEVSSFCKEGEESIHNSSYWAQRTYIGVGAGAVGTVYGAESTRWTNTRDIPLYESFWERCAGEGLERVREVEVIPLGTREEEFLMTALRTSRGVNSALYRRAFSSLPPWHGDIEQRLSAIKRDDLRITLNADGTKNYALTPDALLFLNRILLAL